MALIKCKMCGGDLTLNQGQSVAECEYCGTRQTVPSADNEKKLLQFERADWLRRNCEFDKAAGVYETIVSEFRQEAEAYWGLVLCKYGIEYVDDPATGKKLPTCHRSSYDSVMDDENLELTMDYADAVARKQYREEAKQLEALRKGIVEVSGKEAPYDIFICYKETDETGDRTLDSVLAQDIYGALTDKGYRVFFSRISLEDKLGQAYEPYIFAALNSAKVMLVIGTKPEYFTGVWVKNEWSRFLKLMKQCRIALLDLAYGEAVELMHAGNYEQAIRAFTALDGYRDSKEQIHTCQQAILERNYSDGLLYMQQGQYEQAYAMFTAIPGYRDAGEQAREAYYQMGLECWNARDYERSNAIFTELGAYKDSLSLLHVHEYEAVTTLEPGCETQGEERFDCITCDYFYTAPVAATGHMYEETVVKAAGCTTEGEAAFTCKCGKTYNETVAPTGHSYNDGVITTYATCESDGVRTYSCHCGDSYTQTIGATGYDYTTASCTSDSHCLNCGHVREAAYGHTTTTGVCSRCGYNFTAPLTFSGSGRFYNGTDTVYHTFTLPKGKYRATITVDYKGGGAGWGVGMDGQGLLYFGYGYMFESGTFTCDFDMYYDTTGDIRVTIDGSYTLTVAPLNE